MLEKILLVALQIIIQAFGGIIFFNRLVTPRVSYHFESKIDEILGKIHEAYQDCDLCDNENDELYYNSLQFRLLRQNGYRISAGTYFSNLLLL
ncbi:hypothetical protein WN943_003172 [Citrus x changshan-huyou]